MTVLGNRLVRASEVSLEITYGAYASASVIFFPAQSDHGFESTVHLKNKQISLPCMSNAEKPAELRRFCACGDGSNRTP